jgi:hypothetical protein
MAPPSTLTAMAPAMEAGFGGVTKGEWLSGG